jgi:hypothetical protein
MTMNTGIGRHVRESLDKLMAEDFGMALHHALFAVAATSRRRFGKKRGQDAKAFKDFVKGSMGVITSFGIGLTSAGLYLGKPVVNDRENEERALEAILYEVRCSQAHELSWPENVQFTERTIGGSETILIPKSIIYGLIAAVVVAPENRLESITSTYAFVVCGEAARVNEFWGNQGALMSWIGSVRKRQPGAT